MHLLLITGGSSGQRRAAAARYHSSSRPIVALDAASLPFVRPSPDVKGAMLVVNDVERAFPTGQSAGTRLVLTQSTYAMQKWIDGLGPEGGIIATADRAVLMRGAAEAFQARGPWRLFEQVDLSTTAQATSSRPRSADEIEAGPSGSAVIARLVSGYSSPSVPERVALCREAAELDGRCEVAQLALASALREANDASGARAALDRAIALAPDWEAAHYEDGKFWLGCDDIERARDAFQRAADLMPTFSAAWSNLGATLGELDEPDRAIAAFRRALAHDPLGFPTLNNIGVVTREIGRLDESEAAFRRVIELAPDFVFGYYNLGHTLFLAGQYGNALAAYEEGQRRDPEKNRRQGCRLAMMRLANGDAAGAERDLWHFADAAPAAEREDLLREAHEIATALLATRPELGTARPLVDRIGAEIGQ